MLPTALALQVGTAAQAPACEAGNAGKKEGSKNLKD